MTSKRKIDKLDLIRFKKNFCSAKDTFKRKKRQITDCEKISVNHISDKGLVSGLYKELSKLSIKNKQHN